MLKSSSEAQEPTFRETLKIPVMFVGKLTHLYIEQMLGWKDK